MRRRRAQLSAIAARCSSLAGSATLGSARRLRSSSHDVRWSNHAITAGNSDAATQVGGLPVLSPAGTAEHPR
jgi:hypothetical protein